MGNDFGKLWELRRLVQEFEKLDQNIFEGEDLKNVSILFGKQ